MTPASVNSPFSDSLVRTQRALARQKEPNKLLKKTAVDDVYEVGDRVYVDLKDPKQFNERGFSIMRDQIFNIVAVNKIRTPFMYTVANQTGTKKIRKFYSFELRPAPKTDEGQFFEVEKILERRKGADGKEEVKVKFKFYPESEAEWVKADQMTGSTIEEQKKTKTKKKKGRKRK